jgi:carbamoyl-phosphate synthase large subunit
MNARFGGGYPFSHMAGVNLPLAIVKWARGESVSRELLEAKVGVMTQKDISMVYLN